jgi:regulator of protease activity HflC (stomatin/prohibitin superfamily)
MNYHYLSIICLCVSLLAFLIPVSTLGSTKLRHVFLVPEGSAGLLYHDGLYVHRRNAGRHVLWGRGWRIFLIDLRKSTLHLPCLEVLTQDFVSFKIDLFITWRVEDPAGFAHESPNSQAELCKAVRLALREVIGESTFETLLDQRFEIGARVLARAEPQAAGLGVRIIAVNVREVSLPAELKSDFAAAARTRLESRAAPESSCNAAAA